MTAHSHLEEGQDKGASALLTGLSSAAPIEPASPSRPEASIPSRGFTPGPWAWFGNRSGGVYLATPDRGRRYIMGFSRYGMNGAQPTFCVGNIMRPAAELVSFAVGDGTARGFKEADGDASVYRYDIREIDHPDARLIAAAPDMYEALASYADQLCEGWCEGAPEFAHFDDCGGCRASRVCAKARGQ
jgi:hypothetical protein